MKFPGLGEINLGDIKQALSNLGVAPTSNTVAALPVQPVIRNATVDTLNVMLSGTDLKVKALEVVPGDNDFLPGRTLVIDTSQCMASANPETAARFGMGYLTTIRQKCELMTTPIEMDGRNATPGEMRITLSRDGFNNMRETTAYKEAQKQVQAPVRSSRTPGS